MTKARTLTKRHSSFVVAALIGPLLAAGCAAAATRTTTSGGQGTAQTSTSASGSPAGPQRSTSGGVVQISDYSNSDGPKPTVVLTGVIGDFGEGLRTYANGTIEKQYNQLDLVVTHGSFRLNIVGIESQLVSAFNHFPSNTSTCSGIVTATGTAPIVKGSGTGAYKRISGTFMVTITVHEVDSWPKCTVLLSQTIVTSGSGTVSFG